VTALERLDDAALRSAVSTYRSLLRTHQERLNRLNVYPVPDGDTGTNMALTLESVTAELDAAAPGMAAACTAISRGSLMGARGNSGVILSQILRGLCGVLGRGDAVDGPSLAEALRAASEAAYEAVMAPVEGTILTVVRKAADAAEARGEASLADILEAAGEGARLAVEETPSLLPVLAAAGVVDSGGSGLVLLLDALLHVVDGRPLPPSTDAAAPTFLTAAPAGAVAGGDVVAGGPRYEIMFLLDAPDERIGDFKAAWADLGESIVVVGGEGLWNCHIHTDGIGPSIEAAVEIGRPRHIRVTDLSEQVAEEAWVRQGIQAGRSEGREEATVAGEPMATGVVAVAAGPGVVAALQEMGVAEIVPGGQTMNPSTRDVLAAVEATVADGVVILPNNKNVVAMAEQVPALAGKPAAVVGTRSLVEGVAALMAYDPKADLESNVEAMGQAAAEVVGGEVVRAVRDARVLETAVRAGDHLGLAGGDVVLVEADLALAACRLLDRIVGNGHELITVITGTGAEPVATEAIRSWVAEHRPGAAVEVHDWSYPNASYLFSVE